MDNINDLPINIFDAGVILILLVSAFLAYTRGFVHDSTDFLMPSCMHEN